MIDIKDLKFDANGLIPTIVIDEETDVVLMLAYMNEESLKISMNEGKTCFWSRSRNDLWRKGETSGNVQHIKSIKTDCDKDTLLISVSRNGPACHTGADSCFYEDIYVADAKQAVAGNACPKHDKRFSLNTLHGVIADRKANKKPGSYTTYLFEKGIDKILKKIGEESTEVIIAAKEGDKASTIYELADLTYHAMVLMTSMDITPDDIKAELESRYIKGQETTS